MNSTLTNELLGERHWLGASFDKCLYAAMAAHLLWVGTLSIIPAGNLCTLPAVCASYEVDLGAFAQPGVRAAADPPSLARAQLSNRSLNARPLESTGVYLKRSSRTSKRAAEVSRSFESKPRRLSFTETEIALKPNAAIAVRADSGNAVLVDALGTEAAAEQQSSNSPNARQILMLNKFDGEDGDFEASLSALIIGNPFPLPDEGGISAVCSGAPIFAAGEADTSLLNRAVALNQSAVPLCSGALNLAALVDDKFSVLPQHANEIILRASFLSGGSLFLHKYANDVGRWSAGGVSCGGWRAGYPHPRIMSKTDGSMTVSYPGVEPAPFVWRGLYTSKNAFYKEIN